MRVLATSIWAVNSTLISLGMIIIVVLLFLTRTPFLDLLELKTYDLRYQARGDRPPSPEVVLAVIDEKSLAAEGRWPWPRSKLAALVDRLSQEQAKVIGFDMAFLEPDREPQNDLILARAFKRSSAAVVLGYFFLMRAADAEVALGQQVIDQSLERLSASKYPLILYGQGHETDSTSFLKAYAPMGNLEVLSAAAASSGHLILGRDPDQAIRWMPLVIQGGEDVFPPLALWCVWHYFDKPQLLVKAGRYGVEGIQMGQRSIPTDEKGQLLINYLGPPKTFPHISISDILSGQFPPGTFTNKIVLVGATAVGIHDLLNAPLSPNYAAVEIHATVIDNLLTQDFLTRPSWARTYDLFAIIIFGGLIGIALPRLGVFRGLGLAIGLAVVHIVTVYGMFVIAGVWVMAVYPLLALAATYIGLSFNQLVRQLRQTFRSLQEELEEHKRTAAELRQRETQYRDLVEGSLQGISIVTKDGTRVFANSALARIWGYESPDELIGRSLWENIAPHERSPLQASLSRQLLGIMTPAYRAYQTVKKDGTLIWTERLASPMLSDGDIVILEAYIDVTERHRLEAQLHQAQKMQAIGTLAGGISHDFNNLLTSILGYTELARQELRPDQAAGHYLTEVLTAGTRAKDLVQQILTFSRQTEIRRSPIQLQPVIQEVLSLLRAALPASIVIQPVLEANAGLVLADATQMHQVLLNLCTNAAHAMRETGGVIEVRLDAVDVTPDSPLVPLHLQAGPYVRLQVRDNGQGMTSAVMERIFEPFFTTKRTGEGTGLGLAVVHGIVMRHEGDITVESIPARGTTFTVHLPQIAEAVIADRQPEHLDTGGNEHILFVDDEEVLVYLGKAILESLGYQVTGCSGSSEALDIFQEMPHQFDLVITDYTMPDMNGEALAHALRQIRPGIPIILCTGLSDVNTAERAQALGLNAVVLKPWTSQDLGMKIRQVLAHRPTEGT